MRWTPALLLLLGLALALGHGGDSGPGLASEPYDVETSAAPPAESPPAEAPPPEAPPEPSPPEPAPAEPPSEPPPADAPPPEPIPVRPMSWQAAGAFVWHETDVDPEALGEELRRNGFGWVAVFLHDGLVEDALVADWVARFQRSSGLPVGGWGVLRTAPEEEAALAHALVERHGLAFYVANAEAEYGYTGPEGPDAERFERSRRFVDAFRARLPGLPSGLSTYCRADRHDLDWASWNRAGFVLLPQAYANDFGPEATPAECVRGATGFFARERVHPTVGMHPGARRPLGAWRYARLLEEAGTVGFSVYLAETRMTPAAWGAFGVAIARLGIARTP